MAVFNEVYFSSLHIYVPLSQHVHGVAADSLRNSVTFKLKSRGILFSRRVKGAKLLYFEILIALLSTSEQNTWTYFLSRTRCLSATWLAWNPYEKLCRIICNNLCFLWSVLKEEKNFSFKKLRSDAIFRATCQNFQHIKYLSSELLFKKLELNFFENKVHLELTKSKRKFR